jgi:hypothetical protein
MEPEKTPDASCTDDLVNLDASDLRNRDISDSADSSNSGDNSNSKNNSDSRDNSLTDDFSDEESICRSPTKSPKKAVRKLLQRKDLAVSKSVTPDGSTVACGSDPGVQANLLPTDADFQFKEPKFRKKKFIFHPFTRAADNSCVPDPEKVNAGVSSLISIDFSDSYSVFSFRKR